MSRETSGVSGEETINWHPADKGNSQAEEWFDKTADSRKKQGAVTAEEQRARQINLTKARTEVIQAAGDPDEVVDPVQLDLSAERDALRSLDETKPAGAFKSWGERARGFLGKIVGR